MHKKCIMQRLTELKQIMQETRARFGPLSERCHEEK